MDHQNSAHAYETPQHIPTVYARIHSHTPHATRKHTLTLHLMLMACTHVFSDMYLCVDAHTHAHTHITHRTPAHTPTHTPAHTHIQVKRFMKKK